MKKIISWLIVVITVFSLLTTGVNCNADNRSKNYKYTIENTKTLDSVTYSLIKKSDISTNKTTTFYAVTRLLNFEDLKTIKTINIASDIDKIPVKAILNYDLQGSYYDSIVEKINLPETITYIGSHAFDSMKNLKEIKLPSKIKKIDDFAFSGCSSLKTLVFPKKITVISKGVCSNCLSLKNVTFKSKIKTINSFAFNNCKSLKSIKLPKSLKAIYGSAFYNSGITSLKIPYNVTAKKIDYSKIKYQPFDKMKKLKSITFKNLNSSFWNGMFNGCKSLKEIHLESIKSLSNIKIRKLAFSSVKPGIKFYVKNKKVAKDLKKKLKHSGVKNAKIYIGKKLIYKNITDKCGF